MKWSKIKPGEVWELSPGFYVCRSPRDTRNVACPDCPPDFDPRPVTGPDAKPADKAEFLRRRQVLARAAIGGAA